MNTQKQTYHTTSLNFSDFRRDVYLRGRLLKNLRNDTKKVGRNLFS